MRIVGLDLGTSAIKAVLFELGEHAEVKAVASLPHPLSVPEQGYAEQDAEEALKLSIEALKKLDWDGVQAVGVSGAMHSLLPLDKQGKALCSSWTWADLRASAEALELRKQDPTRAGRTGTPIHPMAWPAKLLWMKRHQSELFKSVDLFVGLKEYVNRGLAGTLCMDSSIASATGCYLSQSGTWEDEQRVPRVVAPDSIVGQLRISGLPAVPLVAGGGDGPLSNLGSGADEPHLAALSIGTSGAVRVICRGPQGDPSGKVFCYHLVDDWWVRGGAISNGTLAVEWLRQITGGDSTEDLVKEGCAHSSDGLLFLPYLAGERAPHWDPSARGVFCGLSLHHHRGHLARAVLEGIAFALKDVFVSGGLEAGVREVRACGGLTRSSEWMQILADVLELPVASVVSPEAAALGAAMLAARALGFRDKIKLPALETFRPGKPVYRGAFERYRGLYPALEGKFSVET